MTFVDEMESDFSRFHRLDIWSVGVHRVMRLAPHLPAYGGALALAMQRSAGARAQSTPAEQSTDYPQTVDNDDTPAHVIEQAQRDAMVKQFTARGVQVTGVREISPEEMERQLNG